VLYEILGLTFLNVPWTPVALIGTAVAFMVGFQNNAAYERIWEARKIWGSIVNTSMTWGMKIQDLVRILNSKSQLSADNLKEYRRVLVYRHIAWLTALRYAMRERKSWETQHRAITNQEWRKRIYTPEYVETLEESMKPYLTIKEYEYVLSKTNKPTAILYLQSSHLRQLYENDIIGEFTFLNLENVLEELFTHQGKTERIKNFRIQDSMPHFHCI
jgi:putative membrane protein